MDSVHGQSVGWGFSGAGRICFGRGSAEQLPRFVQRRGWKGATFIVDPAMVVHASRLSERLQEVGCRTRRYSEFSAEPDLQVATAIASQETRVDHPSDVVIVLGGGSAIDLAKIVAILLRHGGHPRDYFGFDRVPGPVVPLVALPTTAGTGSEVSHAAVLTDPEAAMKVSTLSEYLRPTLAIVDSRFTDSCPRHVSAESGIDALVHAIEGHSARDWSLMQHVPHEARAYEGSHPLGRLLAREATRLIFGNLERAVTDPQDVEARDAMALAATYAGLAFSNCGVALVHGLEYPLGARVHCSHGAGNGTLLPYVMEFNLPASIDRYAELARAIDAPAGTAQMQSQWLIEQVVELRQRIGIRHRLREYGLAKEDLDLMAEKTSRIERLMTLNPRSATKEDLRGILERAY